MWPPVSERLLPLTSTTAEMPQNDIQPDLQDIVESVVDCRARDRLRYLSRVARTELSRRMRSMRRAARTEPLYRRANNSRHEPYPTNTPHRHDAPTNAALPDQEQVLALGITNDDIQAAGILMLFSKSLETRGGELSVYQDNTVNSNTQSVMLPNNNMAVEDCPAPTNWLQMLSRQPRQTLLRTLQNLSIPPFELPRDRRRWRNDLNVLSCMMLSWVMPNVPSMPVPVVVQQAAHVADLLVSHARHKKMPKEQATSCADCGLLPVPPVTGQCGHTRCLECIENSDTCACGEPAPEEPNVDTCVQNLISIILCNKQPSRVALRAAEQPLVKGQPLHDFVCAILSRVIQENCQALARRRTVAQRLSRGLRVSLTISPDSFTAPDVPARLPMTPQARLLHACELILRQQHLEAAAHLARAATNSDFDVARKLLVQTIVILLEEYEPERLSCELFQAVSLQAAESWLAPGDLECVLCRDTYVAPVTTPCGHTYCRNCIECSMDYRKVCPLCKRDLTDFNLALTRQSEFVCAALASIDMAPSQPPPLPEDPNIVPVFVCVSAFPRLPCPLLISAPRYRVFIRRILESGSRRLGIVSRNYDIKGYYGTMLEVRDCVECDDGRIILSTIGISRFRLVNRLNNSCLARVETLEDDIPQDQFVIRIMREMSLDVVLKSLIWLNNLDESMRLNIEQSFGRMPLTVDEEWWSKPDGPDWLWWLVASVPLAPELQTMMIASNNLLTRLRVIRRALLLVTGSPPGDGLLPYGAALNVPH